MRYFRSLRNEVRQIMKSHFTSSTARTFPALCIVAALTAVSGASPVLAEDSDAAAPAVVTPAPSQAMPDHAQPTFGAIACVVRSSAKTPIPGAKVTAARSDGKGIWT